MLAVVFIDVYLEVKVKEKNNYLGVFFRFSEI